MSTELSDTELKDVLDRWISQWNEPDPERRSRLIRELWAEDGYQIMVNPPEGIRESAAQFGVPYPAVEIRGHQALFDRVSRAYEMFVADGEYFFERHGEAIRHAGAAVALTWAMRSRADGEAVATGLEVLTFAADGRVHTNHEYVA